MARAIWSGAISFGLVNIPVRLFSAVSRKTVRFHQIDGESGKRIAQRRVDPETGEEVPYERLVKGYEIGPDRYVIIEPQELDSLSPEKSRTVDIEDFVDLDQIDPIFYDHPYYLAPGTGADKAYRLLYDAMEEANKVAIARVVLRNKESLVAIRPHNGVLTMETMLFADEVVPPDSLEDMATDAKKTTKRELDMARQLIDSLSGDFDPDKYRDEYRDRVLDLIERKAQGEEIVVEAAPEQPKEVPDLMAALEASIAAAKSPGGRKASETSSDGAKSSGAKSSKPAGRSKASSGSKSSNGGKKSSGSGSRRKTAKK